MSSSSLASHSEFTLNKICEEEEVDNIVFGIREEIITRVMEEIDQIYMHKQVYKFVSYCAVEALKKVIIMNHYFHNPAYPSVSDHPAWKPDKPGPTSKPDSWAAYYVPIRYEVPPVDIQVGPIKPEPEEVDIRTKESLRVLYNLQDPGVGFKDRSSLNVSEVDFYDLGDLSTTANGSEGEEHPPSLLQTYSQEMLGEEELLQEEEILPTVFSRTALGEDLDVICPPASVTLTTATVPSLRAIHILDEPKVEPYSSTKTTLVVKKSKSKDIPDLPDLRTDVKLKMKGPEPEEKPVDTKKKGNAKKKT